jgi:hypothetical protein
VLMAMNKLLQSVGDFVESTSSLEDLEYAHKLVNKLFKAKKKFFASELGNDSEHQPEVQYEHEQLIQTIRADLKSRLPYSGCAPEEVFVNPTGHEVEGDAVYENQEGQEKRGTWTVDYFLVNEQEFEHMQDVKQLPISRCFDCGSYKVEDVEFISHSYSLEDLRNLFTSFLPNLTGKTVVDVGSRLGTVLYSVS